MSLKLGCFAANCSYLMRIPVGYNKFISFHNISARVISVVCTEKNLIAKATKPTLS